MGVNLSKLRRVSAGIGVSVAWHDAQSYALMNAIQFDWLFPHATGEMPKRCRKT